jgi:hypothetical protein
MKKGSVGKNSRREKGETSHSAMKKREGERKCSFVCVCLCVCEGEGLDASKK